MNDNNDDNKVANNNDNNNNNNNNNHDDQVPESLPMTPSELFRQSSQQKVREIMRDASLSAAEKQRRVHRIMIGASFVDADKASRGNSSQKTGDCGRRPTEEELRPSYHPVRQGASGAEGDDGGAGQGERVLGCKHYKRACKMRAACCGAFFTCRFCHDEAVDGHTIDRYATKEMLCMVCGEVQPANSLCRNEECKHHDERTPIARYYCNVCKFWDDEPGRDIYHCDKCNLCRRGRGIDIDFFHCDTCNMCLSVHLRNKHRCIERSLESNCPICHEFLFTSVKPVVVLNCGHSIHLACKREYLRSNYTCPICHKSIGDARVLFMRIQLYLQRNPMPEMYRDHVAIVLCNDCNQKTQAPYHFLYHKCASCNSYNTTLVSQSKQPELAAQLLAQQEEDYRKLQERIEGVLRRRAEGAAGRAAADNKEQENDQDDDEEQSNDQGGDEDEDEDEDDDDDSDDSEDSEDSSDSDDHAEQDDDALLLMAADFLAEMQLEGQNAHEIDDEHDGANNDNSNNNNDRSN